MFTWSYFRPLVALTQVQVGLVVRTSCSRVGSSKSQPGMRSSLGKRLHHVGQVCNTVRCSGERTWKSYDQCASAANKAIALSEVQLCLKNHHCPAERELQQRHQAWQHTLARQSYRNRYAINEPGAHMDWNC